MKLTAPTSVAILAFSIAVALSSHNAHAGSTYVDVTCTTAEGCNLAPSIEPITPNATVKEYALAALEEDPQATSIEVDVYGREACCGQVITEWFFNGSNGAVYYTNVEYTLYQYPPN
jgi:hypothetical protein